MSKFQEILQARRGTGATSSSGLSGTQKPEALKSRVAEKKRGRPAAKRSDPDFLQVTAYIRKETHRKTKIRLLEEGQGREFSELVEVMLEEWLGRKK
jgi:hypothetical protein